MTLDGRGGGSIDAVPLNYLHMVMVMTVDALAALRCCERTARAVLAQSRVAGPLVFVRVVQARSAVWL
jgi:hypothetical protein